MVTRIRIGGDVVKGKSNNTNKIRSHFLEHFRHEPLPFISLSMGSFKKVNPSLACDLEAIPSDEEIIIAIKRCDPSKVLTLNSF